jgi:hypothetical protein
MPKGLKMKLKKIIAVSVLAVMGISWYAENTYAEHQEAKEQQIESTRLHARLGDGQADLENLWLNGREQYSDAPNEIQQSAIFNDISQKTNALIAGNDNQFDWFYMRITCLDTDHGGDTVGVCLASPLNNRIHYSTQEYYAKGSPFYNMLANMRVGDYVMVKGEFLPVEDEKEGGAQKWETSLTEEGAFDKPDFLIKIDTMAPAPSPDQPDTK